MIIVRVLVKIQPQHKNEFVQLMNDDLEDTMKFEGCKHFALYEDTQNENGFILYEEWESQANFDAYRTSEYFKARGGQLFPLMDGTPDSQYYQADPIPQN